MNSSHKIRKVGFFGGAFDPVHFGHLNLCISLMEKCGLDEVLVSPSGIPPIKPLETVAASPKDRLAMVKIAFEGMDKVKIWDYEVAKNAACYTVDTLRHLKQTYPLDELYLLLGTDNAISLPKWKEAEEIIKLAKPLVAKRRNDLNIKFDDKFKDYFENSFIDTNQFDISSTEIKERLSNKKFCKHLIPSKVLDYIYSNQLYFFN